MLSTKDEAGFLRPLAPLARSIATVPVPDEPASRDPAEAARLVARARLRAQSRRPDVASALGAIVAARAARRRAC